MEKDLIWCTTGCGYVIGIERDELIFYINKWNKHVRFFGVGDFWHYLSYEIEQSVRGLDPLWNLSKKVNTASIPIIKEVVKHGSK